MSRLGSSALLTLLLLAGCGTRSPMPARSTEAELAGAERAFAQAAAREGIRDAFVEFAGDSAILFRPEPENAQAVWRARPRVAGRLSWYPVFVRAAASGEMGMTTGPYESRDSTGALRGTGWYVTVWRREPEGWRFMVDLGTRNDPPAAPPAPWQPAAASHTVLSARASGADAVPSLLAADSAFGARAEAAGFAAALRSYGDREMRLHRDGAAPRAGLAAAVAAASSDSARRYSAVPARGYASAAGDFGWTWGEYRLVHAGAGRRETGHYVRVWSRDRGGPWRVLLDVTTPRPPERDE